MKIFYLFKFCYQTSTTTFCFYFASKILNFTQKKKLKLSVILTHLMTRGHSTYQTKISIHSKQMQSYRSEGLDPACLKN